VLLLTIYLSNGRVNAASYTIYMEIIHLAFFSQNIYYLPRDSLRQYKLRSEKKLGLRRNYGETFSLMFHCPNLAHKSMEPRDCNPGQLFRSGIEKRQYGDSVSGLRQSSNLAH